MRYSQIDRLGLDTLHLHTSHTQLPLWRRCMTQPDTRYMRNYPPTTHMYPSHMLGTRTGQELRYSGPEHTCRSDPSRCVAAAVRQGTGHRNTWWCCRWCRCQHDRSCTCGYPLYLGIYRFHIHHIPTYQQRACTVKVCHARNKGERELFIRLVLSL